jgi:hypothetical protein
MIAMRETIGRFAKMLAQAGVLAVFTSGCLIIPTPHFDSGKARANLDKNSPQRIEPGVTRREQMLLQLGEPDAVSSDKRKISGANG